MANENFYQAIGKFICSVKIKLGAVDRSSLPKFVKDVLKQIGDKEFENYDEFFKLLKEACVIELKDSHIKKVNNLLIFGGRFDKLQLNEHHIMPRVFGNFGGKDLIISVEPYRRCRSDRQNRYLHGVVLTTIISFEMRRGSEWIRHLSHKEAMEVLKAYIYDKVLGHKFVEHVIDGIPVLVMQGKRMSQMTTEEFFNATEEIRDFYNEIGCPIPEPVKENFIADFVNVRREGK